MLQTIGQQPSMARLDELIGWTRPFQPPIYVKSEPKHCVGPGVATATHIPQVPGPLPP